MANQIGHLAGLPVQGWDQGDKTFALPVHLASRGITVTVVNTTASTTGDNEIVAAPGAGNRIVVTAFVMQNESATATTLILRSAATTNGWRMLCQNQGDGLSKDFPDGAPWRLGANEALNLNLSGANSCGVTVMYYTETI